MTLQEVFSPVKDERRGPARKHDLHEMIVMAICGVLCGCDGWVDIADWCEDEEKWLKRFLVLRHDPPSHDTFGDVFRLLDGDVFEDCFRQWISRIVGVAEGVIALDGKTVRGSKDGPNTALHMVSAYATKLGVSLGQEGAAGKGHELVAIKALLDTLALKGCIVTLDALGSGAERLRSWGGVDDGRLNAGNDPGARGSGAFTALAALALPPHPTPPFPALPHFVCQTAVCSANYPPGALRAAG